MATRIRRPFRSRKAFMFIGLCIMTSWGLSLHYDGYFEQATCPFVGELRAMEMTYAEYLATEEASEVRREFYEGTVRPIPDATLEHSALSVAVATVLFNQIRGRCNAF